MKKLFLFFSIILFNFLVFAQEVEIVLPELTTYVPATVEQKIVVTAEEIEARHFESLSDIVESCGIQNLAYGPYGLDSKPSVRGFTDETVRVVIDGVCVNNVRNGVFDFSTLNLKAVEKIEIVRGGFTEGVEDEGAVGGVIYITMKKTETRKSVTADAAVKTFFSNTQPVDSCFQKLAFSGPLSENTFLNASGSLNYAENKYFYKSASMGTLTEGAFGGLWYGLDVNHEGYVSSGVNTNSGEWKCRENAQVTDAHADAFLTHYYGNGNYLSLGEIFYGGHKHTPGKAFSDEQGLQRDYDNNISLTMWNPAVAELFNLKNSVVWICNNCFYKNAKGTEDSRHNLNTIKYTGSMDFTSFADGRIRQLIGISSDFSQLDSTNDGRHVQVSGVLKETTKIAVGGGWSFTLPLAAKFCLNDEKLNFAFVPKVGVAWEVGLFRFFADLYRMVQFPNMDDLYWSGGDYHGNPNLRPESGWGADLGFYVDSVSIKYGVLHGGLTVFSDYYKDKIKWESGTTENIASAFYLGMDFNFGMEFFNRFLTFDLNGEYLYNRLLDESQPLTYGKRIMWTPDFVCSASFGLNFEFVSFKLNASYTGRRYNTNLNVSYLKPYVLLNFVAEGVEIAGHFTPYLKLDNALNWQYQAVEGYPMPGISLTIGARYIF